MNWLITFQDFDYDRPVNKPKTVVTKYHPVDFCHSGRDDQYGNRTRVILFAMETDREEDRK